MIDFMIMEAVAAKSRQEEEEAQKKSDRKNWRNDKEGLNKLREAAG